MKKIKLHNEKYVLVDDTDYIILSQSKWHIGARGYVMRYEKGNKTLSMHRIIMNFPELCVDHINGDKLDNRRENLRLVTNHQNLLNRGKNKNNSSGYKGVNFQNGKWHAKITFNKIQKHIGYFDNKIDAAKAYDSIAKILHGIFARLNFPED